MVNSQDFLDEVKADTLTFIEDNSTYVAVGTGTTPETSADAALETEVLRKSRQESSKGVSNVITSMFIGSTEANGNDITEVGVLNSSSAGTLVMRRTFPAIEKTAAVDVWIDVEETVDVTQ